MDKGNKRIIIIKTRGRVQDILLIMMIASHQLSIKISVLALIDLDFIELTDLETRVSNHNPGVDIRCREFCMADKIAAPFRDQGPVNLIDPCLIPFFYQALL